MNTSGKTSRIGHVLAMADSTTVQFRQTIDEAMVITLDTVVHTEVYDFQILGYIVTIHKLLCISMSRTEEQYINLIQRKFVGKNQIRFTIESLMYVGNLIAGVTAAVYKLYVYIRVINQQTNQFARRITCPTDNSCFNHTY